MRVTNGSPLGWPLFLLLRLVNRVQQPKAKLALKRVVWRHATQKGIDGTPAVSADGSMVYVGSFDNNVYALAATSSVA
jgi:hypothetical protein